MKGISGKKAQLNARHLPHSSTNSRNAEGEMPQILLRLPSPQSLMIHHTLKENTLPLFKEWLKSATTKGKEESSLAQCVCHCCGRVPLYSNRERCASGDAPSGTR